MRERRYRGLDLRRLKTGAATYCNPSLLAASWAKWEMPTL